MKKNKTVIICFLLFISGILSAQNGTLPIDPNLRYGKLNNGLTYYIRHNGYPEKRADFYIAQNVGSVLEEDSQSGLAHFLEHMAFNGTKNFPGRKKMLDYLEKNGVKFGENVNAYTSYDETVYNLSNVPVERETLVDSCLLILHDWSNFITLDDTEIDKERKIINEEWRTRNNAGTRSMDRLFKFAYKGTRYENRMPIGSMDVVMNFPYKSLKNYYHKWYRPDLQAIIIVGDIDVDKIESQIKEMFTDIKKPENPAKREYFSIPDYTEPKVITITDAETTSTNISVYYTHPAQSKKEKSSEEGYREVLTENLVSSMLASRLAEITQKPDAPFLRASAANGEFIIVPTKEAWTLRASSKNGEIKKALTALLTENERVLQHGFTDSELQREKNAYLTQVSNVYNNRDKQNNSSYVREYVANFTSGEAIPGIEYEYTLIKNLLQTIDTQTVHDCIRRMCSNKNVLLVVTGPEKEGLTYPDNNELLQILNQVSKEKLLPYSENVLPENLIEQLPSTGKVIDVKPNNTLGATEWILNNGVHVILKKTNFKDDQILFSSVSYGGTSLFKDDDALNAKLIKNVMPLGGLGQFNIVELSKILTGRVASVGLNINNTTQGLSGMSSVKDVETMLQLIYLTLTTPRKDDEAYKSFINRLKNQIQNSESAPSTALSDTLMTGIYGDNPRIKRIHLADVDKLSYDRILDMYKELYSNPANQTFTFVGSLDETTLKPLIEKYLGALPNTKTRSEFKKTNTDMRRGEYSKIFEQTMENPKTTSVTLIWGTLARNLKNNITINILEQILDLVYTRTIREAEGGTYGVSTRISIERPPYDGRTSIQITFDTDPEKESHLRGLIQSELKKIADNGPQNDDFSKTIEYIGKSLKENEKNNNYWLGALSSFYFYGEDIHTTYLDVLNTIKPSDVQQITKKLLEQGNCIEVVMNPQKSK